MSSIRPTVSIITPTYNREDYICESLDSVLAQSFTDWELILIDDGSTDDTKKAIEPYLVDKRIHYYFQENQGQSTARSYALTQACGQYICFLDSDNRWLPDKLDRQLEIFNTNPYVDIVYGDVITIGASGNEVHRKNMKRYSGNITSRMLRDNFVSMNTAMARRKCFNAAGLEKTHRRVADDYEMWLRLSVQSHYWYQPEFYAEYRIMDNQISTDKSSRFEANEKIILDFLKDYPDAIPAQEARSGLSYFYTRKARYLSSIGKRAEAYHSVAKAIRLNPFGKPPWRTFLKVIARNDKY